MVRQEVKAVLGVYKLKFSVKYKRLKVPESYEAGTIKGLVHKRINL